MSLRPKTDLIVVHSSATKPSQNLTAKDIDKMHKLRGFTGIGYHFFIQRNGTVELGRPLFDKGAHAKNSNYRSVGICMAGGVSESNANQPEQNFTEEQYESLLGVIGFLHLLWPNATVAGHRDVYKTACPSFNAKVWYSEHLKVIKPESIYHVLVMFAQLAKPGGTGPVVGVIQQLLGLTPDCAFGPTTEAAVKKFQKQSNLVDDGIVGPKTWAKLYEVVQ